MTDLTLRTERLTLRRPAPQDVPASVTYFMSKRSRFTGGHVPRPSAFKNVAAMLGHWDIRGFGLWAVTRHDDDAILGLVGPYAPDGWPETEIGWMVFDGCEGQGIAQEAARATISDARVRLGWQDIVHYIAPENTRSIRLAERLGATLDPDAAAPNPDAPCLVYRQPRPEALV